MIHYFKNLLPAMISICVISFPVYKTVEQKHRENIPPGLCNSSFTSWTVFISGGGILIPAEIDSHPCDIAKEDDVNGGIDEEQKSSDNSQWYEDHHL